jgi:DNA-binding CsgD family transcriptional regulator
MSAQLAARENRLEDARAAAARGIAGTEATDEAGRLVKLIWVALMVEAEGVERAMALGEPFDEATATTLRARLAAARARPGQWAEGPRYAMLAAAEAGRLDHALGRGEPDPGAPLIAARTAAERMEAAPLVAAVDALARRARIRLDDASEPAPEPRETLPLGLTPREHEVLLLVAEGCTNREIGEVLYMSEKTASVHVSRILAKLDVSGRVEAAAVAHRLGIVS